MIESAEKMNRNSSKSKIFGPLQGVRYGEK